MCIRDRYYFTRHCYYEPFMKVYSTKELSEIEIKKMADEDWSNFNEKEVVMRTASFGHGIGKLEVCARRADYSVGIHVGEQVKGGGKKKKKKGNKKKEEVKEMVDRTGMGDDVVVPLGLMAVLRRQMVEDSKDRGH